eukprot:gene8115-5843_t
MSDAFDVEAILEEQAARAQSQTKSLRMASLKKTQVAEKTESLQIDRQIDRGTEVLIVAAEVAAIEIETVDAIREIADVVRHLVQEINANAQDLATDEIASVTVNVTVNVNVNASVINLALKRQLLIVRLVVANAKLMI